MIWKPNVTVAAVVARDNKFLFVEEVVQNRLVLNQPAGHLDPGESLLDAVKRETLEESAWSVEPQSLLGIHLFPSTTENVTYLRFTFNAKPITFHTDRELDKEITQTLWLTYDEMMARESDHRSHLVKRSVDDYLAGVSYPLEMLHDYHE